MSEQTTGEATPPQGAPAPAPVPPAATAAPEPTATEEPSWLKGRLDQAKRSGAADLLRDLGVEKPEDLKAALTKLREVELAQLSEKERAEKQIAELAPRASRAEELEAAVKGYADRELAQLTEAQRAAVMAVAGSDPSRILRTVEQLRPTWATPAAPPAVAPPAPAPAPAATTSGAPPLPSGGQSTSPTDHKAHFEKLRQTNPFAAAAYAERHFRELS